MTNRIPRLGALSLVIVGALVHFPQAASAQSLADRIGRAPAGRLQFSFAARPGSCGDGRSFIHWSSSTYGSNEYVSFDSNREGCAAGPVRVVLDRAGSEVVGLSAFVGPQRVSDGATDLGLVSAREGAGWLMHLAATNEGRAGRDALLPAMIADSVDNSDELLAIAKDATRPRDVRRSAMNWIPRESEDVPAVSGRVIDALMTIARDANEEQPVRQSALRTVSRLPQGAGIPALISAAGDANSGWMMREAVSTLSSSGDPRARAWLRSAVKRTDLPDEVMANVIRGVGREWATQADMTALRQMYPSLTGEKSREAALSSIAEAGGAETARWFISIAKDENATQSARRRALEYARRAGTSSRDMIALYDDMADATLREALLSIYAQAGDAAAVDKLISIAKTDTNPQQRRRAIQYLSRSDDKRARDAIVGMVEK